MRRISLLGGLSISLVAISAQANVQPYYVSAPIDQAAIDADPSLANFKTWDLHVVVTGNGISTSGQDRFTVASLYSPLAPGSFYSPVGGGDKPVAPGAANLPYDTYVNIPLYVPGSIDPLFGIVGQADGPGSPGPAIFPRAGEQQSLISVCWGSLHTESGNGDYTIARLTVSSDATGPVQGFVMSTSDLNAQTSFGLNLAFMNGMLASGGGSFSLLADANRDNRVNSSDFTAVAQNFSQSETSWAQGDFNGDGKVNALDFNSLAKNYGTNTSAALAALVPEPASLGLFAGMLLLARRRRCLS